MTDIDVVTQTVLLERQGRDRGWWDQMRSCYWPDSTVTLSWYRGDGPGFVDASEAMSGRGDASVHRLSPPAVRIVGDRAFVELPACVEVRTEVDGVTADLVSCTRVVHRLERRAGQWRILTLDCVYERDTLTPAVPGTHLSVPPEQLTAYRAPYALLAWHLARRGYEVSDGLLGDDQPDRTAAFYTETLDWLRG
ncbi:nuclear transport factor 2 family protein [Streptomyces sp. NPDC049954]|uniref:nuclear transport factor 2 family protein n=1 Tax=Streptomyces sp. NPDC049954 TaxID=3155779 RepID=UPI0034127550